MPNIKKFIQPWSETGKTVYGIIRREIDSYILNDSGGNFALSATDPYISFSENSLIKGQYELSESRAIWNDGRYIIVTYKQASLSASPVADTIIGAGDVYIINDTEVILDASVSNRASQTSVDSLSGTILTRATLNDIENSPILAKEYTLSGKASQLSVNNIPLTTLLSGDSRLNYLDASVSSRALESTVAKETTLSNKASQVSIDSLSGTILTIKSKTDLMDWNDITSLKDVALGKWELNPSNNTLTLYRQDGLTILKTFNLTPSIGIDIPAYTGRT